MLLNYKRGQTSVIIRVKILDSSVTTGAGKTGLTSATAGLIISTITDNEATATSYSVTGLTVETVTTLGTYAAPTATRCRFREVDATNHKGLYELQFADARFAVASAKSLTISISGAPNAAETDIVLALRDLDPYDAVRAGLTALPNVVAAASGGLPTIGATIPNATAGAANGLFIAGSNAATSVAGLTTGAISATTITASGAVAFQSTFTVTTSTSLAALSMTTITASGATSLTTLTTSGTTTFNALTVSNATTLSGAVSLGSTLIVTGATTLTGAVTASNASNNIVGIDVAKISGDATAADNAESFFDGTGYAGTNNVIPLVTVLSTYTGNTPQTGDSFIRIGANGSGLTSLAPSATALSNVTYTSARAGYLDNLNVGGAVASQTDINSLNQSASRRLILATVQQYERPTSGSTVYTVEARVFTGDGALVNADSAPTLTGTGQTSGSLAANIGAATNPATGVYRYAYTVAAAATIEPIRFDFSATISTEAHSLSAFTQVTDLVSTAWTSTDASNLTAIFNKLPTKSVLTGTNNLDGDIQLDEATGAPVDSIGVTTLLIRLPSTINLSSGNVIVASNLDKTGYVLSQSFPANFETFSVDGSGRVLLQPTQTGVTIPAVTTVSDDVTLGQASVDLILASPMTGVEGTASPNSLAALVMIATNSAVSGAQLLAKKPSDDTTFHAYAITSAAGDPLTSVAS